MPVDVAADADAVAAGRGAVLSEAARAVLRAVRHARSISTRLTPALPISTPASYAAELAGADRTLLHAGHARGHEGVCTPGVFNADEFLAQARITADENLRQYRLRARSLPATGCSSTTSATSIRCRT